MVKKVAIRLGVNSADKVEVIRDFGDMESKAKASFGGIGQAAQAANTKLQDQADRLKRLAAQAQALQTPVAGALASFAGVNFDKPASAAASASAFKAAFADQERDARALLAQLDPLAAAQDRYNVALEKANSLKAYGKLDEAAYTAEVTRATDALNIQRAVIEQNELALQKEIAALRAASAETPTATPLQSHIDTVTYGGAGSARDNANAREYAALLDQQEREVRALKTALEPMAAAQDRYNAAIERLNVLKPHLSVELYDKAINQAKADLDKFEKSQLSNKGTQFTAFQLQNLSYQANDIVTGILSGQGLLQVAAQQSGQIFQVLQTSEGGVAGGLKSLLGLLNPATVGFLAVAGAVGIGVAAAFAYADAQDKLNLSLLGVGKASGATAAELEALAEQQSQAASISVSAAREQESTYLHMGVTSVAVIKQLIAVSRDYALVTGQDAKSANQELAKAMADPAHGADTMIEKLGALDYSTKQYIISLEHQGELEKAQKILLDEVTNSVDTASSHVSALAKAWQSVSTWASNAWADMGKRIDLGLGGYNPQEIVKEYDAGGLRGYITPDRYKQIKADADKQAAADAARAGQNSRTAENNRLSLLVGGYEETLLPNDKKRNDLLDQRVAIEKALSAGIGDRTTHERALASITKQLNDLDNPKQAGAGRAVRLQREADSVAVDTRENLKLADAYLESSAAGIKAEATRKALTDAVKKGTDQEAAVRREIALTIAQQTASVAKTIATMRDQTAVQASVNKQVEDGTLSYKDMADQRALEQAQLPILTLMTLADADAKKRLQTELDALTAAYAAQNAERDKAQLLSETGALGDDIDLLQKQLDLVRATNAERAIAIAQFEAQREIQDKLPDVDPDNPNADFAAAVDYGLKATQKAKTQNALDLAQYQADTEKSQANQIEQARLQLSLAAANDNQMGLALDKLKLKQDLMDRGLTAQEAENTQAMKNLDILYQINQAYEQRKALSDEIKALSEQEIDRFGDLLKKGDLQWKDWADAAKSAILDVAAELVKLALINPIKNYVLGETNPTLQTAGGGGGFLSTIFSLFTKGASGTPSLSGSSGSSSPFIMNLLPKFARGTLSSPEGWALVGEEGPEIARLPRGTRVYPAGQSRQMLDSSAANSNQDSGWNGPLIGSVIIQAQDLGSFQGSQTQVAARLGRVVQSAMARAR